jgi:ATP/maltotriose-dependent transcriptional regulator MalT
MTASGNRSLEQAVELEKEGYEAFKTGDVDRSRELNTKSLALAREAGDPSATVRALAGLMRLALRDHDFEGVERLARECDEIADHASDASLRRVPLHMRAEAARMGGDLDQARDLYDASIRLNRNLGNERMVAIELANKSWVEIGTGHLDEAESLLRTSLEAADELDEYGIAFCLLGIARVELERGRERGAEILGAAEAVLENDGLVWDPAEQPEYEATLELARVVVGADLDARRAAGRAHPQSFWASA